MTAADSGGSVSTAGDRLLGMLVALRGGLHRSGVDCSLSEAIDAVRALNSIDLADREAIRTALSATLIKRSEDLPVFHLHFDRWFPLTALDHSEGPFAQPDDALQPNGSGVSPISQSVSKSEEEYEIPRTLIQERTLRALDSGDQEALRSAARHAVKALSGVGTQRGSERYFLQRVMHALDLAQLLIDSIRESRLRDPDLDPLAVRHRRDELNRRLDILKRMLADEVRRELYAEVGVTGVGLIAPRHIEDTELVGASEQEQRAMRSAVRELVPKLARRLARQRRVARRGHVDFRRTVRKSMNHGGVPIDVAVRRRAKRRADVVVLCDISGSVAEFAEFTLMLLRALSSEMRSLRCFVFVDGVAEISTLMEHAGVDLDPRLLVTLPGVVVADGHSDYATAFERFASSFGAAVGPSTTVIVTGDARTNYREAGTMAFREIASRADAVYWLNPEPAALWGEHDSMVEAYLSHGASMFEVRTLRQLVDAIAHIGTARD